MIQPLIVASSSSVRFSKSQILSCCIFSYGCVRGGGSSCGGCGCGCGCGDGGCDVGSGGGCGCVDGDCDVVVV